MNLPHRFYKATDEYNTYEKHVNAPYIRGEFVPAAHERAYITVGCAGLYELKLNGKDVTKGLLAPYISNPDDLVYFDRYDVTDLLTPGSNCVGLILGNGMQNASGGRVWDFDIAKFRGAPRFALAFEYENGGETVTEEAGEDFVCKPSPIIFDDIRSGCFFDANLIEDGWATPGFDASGWQPVKPAETPRGEFRLCEADPIKVFEERKPVAIRKGYLDDRFDNRRNMRLDTQFKFDMRGKEGYIFDFGVNTAGIFRLKINGKKGQTLLFQFCEYETKDGRPSYSNTGSFYPDGYGQTAMYICRGGEETFEPSFTYIGYRYAFVLGLEDGQVGEDTLTMLRASSALEERGAFECSDEIMNALGKMVRVSDLSNFYYFPTDCPHREKNGWTGDAAVSAEHMLLTLTVENSYREWLRSVCRAQDIRGALPGIVPTGSWGFEWGNGPAWDNVLSELCWQIYRLRGDLEPARECSQSLFRYLSYISGRRRPDGLIAIGLGDWLQPGKGAGDPNAPLYITDSVIASYIAGKSADLFAALGMRDHEIFARELRESFRQAVRKNCINFSTMEVVSHSQTAQAICIYYGIFEPSEKQAAGRVLVDLVHEKNDHFDCGMIGVRVVFHVLSDLGEGELAYKMITRTDFPSYGMFPANGFTAMPEDFMPLEEYQNPNSLNHHFMGDIASWFTQKVVGIRPNPRFTSANDVDVAPDFISQLDFARAYYIAPCGRIDVEWKRSGDGILLTVSCPEEMNGRIILPAGSCFVDKEHPHSKLSRSAVTELRSGVFTIAKQYTY